MNIVAEADIKYPIMNLKYIISLSNMRLMSNGAHASLALKKLLLIQEINCFRNHAFILLGGIIPWFLSFY